MAKARRHTHKYFKAKLSVMTVFACALPDCTHHMPPHMTDLLNGKKSICWECEDEFTLHPLNMQMDKPICDKCRLGQSDEPEMSPTLGSILGAG